MGEDPRFQAGVDHLLRCRLRRDGQRVTSYILPHFKAVYRTIGELSDYGAGIYGPRNVCQRVSDAGYAATSFVSEMSSGFSGNLGYPLPTAVLPIIEGTVIRLEVAHLPSAVTPKPVRLWWSGVGATNADVDRMWQTFLRRFDIEHTFRLFKQSLGWACPKICTPQAADRWTWLIVAAYTQLPLAGALAAGLRRPWETPASPQCLSPARVRRGFRHLRPKATSLAGAPKPSGPGPGRPPGRRSTRPTPRCDVHIATTTNA